MSKLTPQQEIFAQEYVKCGNATQSYKIAYPKAEKWTESAVWNKASSILRNGKVLARVEELKKELADKNLWTREDAVKVLKGLALDDRVLIFADDNGNQKMQIAVKDTDRINAIKELNKMHGFEADKIVDHKSSDGSMSPKIPEIIINPITNK
ncbi:terminase small subunit [Francisella marina]|uniref:terminase small subunit n=1 Tax=Francisella marina TaxID=2249302 RepID=UPI0011ECEDBD|nr:terminase small subunit [Francisella marina]QEO58310.1 terminase small subunit [Francisella marina]